MAQCQPGGAGKVLESHSQSSVYVQRIIGTERELVCIVHEKQGQCLTSRALENHHLSWVIFMTHSSKFTERQRGYFSPDQCKEFM